MPSRSGPRRLRGLRRLAPRPVARSHAVVVDRVAGRSRRLGDPLRLPRSIPSKRRIRMPQRRRRSIPSMPACCAPTALGRDPRIRPGSSHATRFASFRYGCAREDQAEKSPCSVFLDFWLLEVEPPLADDTLAGLPGALRAGLRRYRVADEWTRARDHARFARARLGASRSHVSHGRRVLALLAAARHPVRAGRDLLHDPRARSPGRARSRARRDRPPPRRCVP